MVRPIREDELALMWKILGKGIKSNKGRYKTYIYNKKSYKRSRIIYSIYHQVMLDRWDIIHHKDENKANDHITNLQLMKIYEHLSHHTAGKRRNNKKISKKPKI